MTDPKRGPGRPRLHAVPVRVTLRLDRTMFEGMKVAAENQGLSVNAFIERALKPAIAQATWPAPGEDRPLTVIPIHADVYEAVERASVEDDAREAREEDASIRALHAAAGLKTLECAHGIFVEGQECSVCPDEAGAADPPPVALPSRRRSFDTSGTPKPLTLAERLERQRNRLDS